MLSVSPRRIGLSGLVFALVVCGLLAAAETPQGNESKAENGLEEGIKLLSEAHFDEAIAAFNLFKQHAPRDPRPYFHSGIALAQAGRLSAAGQELQEAVRLAPDRLEYLVFLAEVFARQKQHVHALEGLARLEKKDVSSQLAPAWLKLLADVYFRLGRTDDALRVLELLSARTPDDPDVDLNRGQIYAALGRWDQAFRAFQRSLEKSTHNPIAYYEVGKIHYARDELALAKKALLAAVEQDETNSTYLQKLGDACLALGEVDEAIEYLNRAERSEAPIPEIYYSLGRTYQKKGDRARGDAYMKKFQETTSLQREKDEHDRAVERFVSQGESQLDQGHHAEAQSLFEKAAQLDPNRWDAHGYLAEMFLSSGDLEHAYPHLVKMEEIDPDSVVGNFLMAKYWYGRKDFERALGYAEKVESGRPGNSELRNLLGNIYVGLGQKERALQEYEAAVHLAPDRADFRENLRRAETARPQLNQDSQK